MSGAVTISLDFEAGWGVIDNGRWRQRESAGVYEALRPALTRFVRRLNETQISCAWAVVGGMVENPDAIDIRHLKGRYGEKTRRFLSEARPSTRDGRDLLDIVQSATCPQLFGSHSYTHLLFDDPDQDSAVIFADLTRARAVNARRGIDAAFLVFPENRATHFDAVRASGFQIVRMAAHGTPAHRGPVARAISGIIRPPSPVVEDTLPSGLRLHHASELMNWGAQAGVAKTLLTRRRIEAALTYARQGAHVHFWLHPFNLAETRGLLDYVEDVLGRLAAWRDAGEIEIRSLT